MCTEAWETHYKNGGFPDKPRKLEQVKPYTGFQKRISWYECDYPIY